MHPTLPAETIDVRDKAVVAERIKGSVSSKQYGYEDLLAPLIAGAIGSRALVVVKLDVQAMQL